MVVVRNELINNGNPYAVLIIGGKSRKYPYMDVNKENECKNRNSNHLKSGV
jgi:outer membrane protein OmpA-like peptidoglycan-associated protein